MQIIDPKKYLSFHFMTDEDKFDKDVIKKLREFSEVKFIKNPVTFETGEAFLAFGFVNNVKVDSCKCNNATDCIIESVLCNTIDYLRDYLADFGVYYTLTFNGNTYRGIEVLLKNLTSLEGIGVIRELNGKIITGDRGTGILEFEYINDTK